MRETRQQRKRESLLRERPEPGALPAWATWGMRAFAGVASLRAIGDMGESVRGMRSGATLAGSGDAMLDPEGRLRKLEALKSIPVFGEVAKAIDGLTGTSQRLRAELTAINHLEESRISLAKSGRWSLQIANEDRRQNQTDALRDMARTLVDMGYTGDFPTAGKNATVYGSDSEGMRAAKEAYNTRLRAMERNFKFTEAEHEQRRGAIDLSAETAGLRFDRRYGEAGLMESRRARQLALLTMDPSLRPAQERANFKIDAAESIAYRRKVEAEQTTLGFTGAAALADASMFGMGSSKLAGTLSKVGGWSAQLQTADAAILPQLKQRIQAEAIAELSSYNMKGTRFAEIVNPATTVIGDPFRIDPRVRDFEAGRTAAQTFASQVGVTAAMAELPAVMKQLTAAIDNLSKNSGLLAN
jgi:hypothetical protein